MSEEITPLKICVMGAIESDLILGLDHLPVSGESVKSNSAKYDLSGIGVTQAITAKRLGSHVNFASQVGNDSTGEMILQRCRREKIDTQYIRKNTDSDSAQTITLKSKNDEVATIIFHGTNNQDSDIELKENYKMAILDSQCLMVQMSLSENIIKNSLKYALENDKFITLDLIGQQKNPPLTLLKLCDIIAVNLDQIKLFAEDFDPFNDPAKKILDLIQDIIHIEKTTLIIKMGERGSRLISSNYDIYMPPVQAFNPMILQDVTVKNSNFGENCFIPAFMAKYIEVFSDELFANYWNQTEEEKTEIESKLELCLLFANTASFLQTLRDQPGYLQLSEVVDFLKKYT